jgi:carbamoyltransferase
VNILGLSYHQGCHDTSAALVCDGELVAAAEEERFTRQKHESTVPLRSIASCLQSAGIDFADIDILAYPDLPFRTGRSSPHGEFGASFFKSMKSDGRLRRRSLLHKRLLDFLLRAGVSFNFGIHPAVSFALSEVQKSYGQLPPVRFFDHHRSHAAAAFLTSGLERASIATIDGQGGQCATVTWEGCETSLRRIDAMPWYNSLGHFYSNCTSYLEFGDYGEGKTMGLASYGNKAAYAELFKSVLPCEGSQWYWYRSLPDARCLGFHPRQIASPASSPYTDFAAAAQNALQEAIQRVVRAAIDKAQCRDLCLGGGVALNCSSNGALLASGLSSSIWIFPASGDAGLSVGAALLAASEIGELRRKRIDTPYWGPEFCRAKYERALAGNSRLVYRRSPDLVNEIAECLASGEVVGWFQGRMEFGPRALGNRSILADPRRADVRDRVNLIKSREPWRPLAPVVPAERAAEFFESSAPSPFMLFATKVRPTVRSLIPAVVHVDGSARPQTVALQQNPLLYNLITAFSERTRVPVLLNTSFNTAEEPIVCTPEDAIRTFLATELDVLVLGDHVVRRAPGRQPPG